MRVHLLTVLLAAALAAGSPARAQGPRERPPGADADDGAAPELHAALRDAYLQELRARLELTDEKQREIEPLLLDMLAVQRDSTRHARDLRQRVMDAADTGATDAECAAAIDALLENELDAAHQVQAARERVATSLTPRQAAIAASFEGPFRQRMREIAAGRPGGTPPGGDDAPPPGAPSPDAFDDERAAEMRGTLRLIFAHEARTSLGLDDAETLALLPRIDALLLARQEALRARRRSQDDLRQLAEDSKATDAALRSALEAARTGEARALEALVAARRGLVQGMPGLRAAKLMAIDLRAQQAIGRRLGDFLRDGDPRGGPGDRPMGPRRRPGFERP
jgi:hypothetical protein